MQQRTPRKITNSLNDGHPSRNSFVPISVNYNAQVPASPISTFLHQNPAPASFTKPDFILGRNTKLNHYLQRPTKPAAASQLTQVSPVKPIFRFVNDADPKEVWNWLLAQTPSRTQHPAVSQKHLELPASLLAPQYPTTGIAAQDFESQYLKPIKSSNKNAKIEVHRFGYRPPPVLESTTANSSPVFGAKSKGPVVVYQHNRLYPEQQPIGDYYATTPSPVPATPEPRISNRVTTPVPATEQGDVYDEPGTDFIIATTAKPYIENDLRVNFKPFLKADQLADLVANGHSYEQQTTVQKLAGVRTGEDGRGVQLSLSTQRPPVGAYYPIRKPSTTRPFHKPSGMINVDSSSHVLLVIKLSKKKKG